MIRESEIAKRAAETGLDPMQAYYQLAAERRIREDLRRGWKPENQRSILES